MKSPKLCCNQPPIIFTGKDVTDHTVHSVTCLMCGRYEIARDRDIAVILFNKGRES